MNQWSGAVFCLLVFLAHMSLPGISESIFFAHDIYFSSLVSSRSQIVLELSKEWEYSRGIRIRLVLHIGGRWCSVLSWAGGSANS
jgi:hypothetical protein